MGDVSNLCFTIFIEPFVVKKKCKARLPLLAEDFMRYFPLSDSFLLFNCIFIWFLPVAAKLGLSTFNHILKKAQVAWSQSPLYPLSSLPSLSLPYPPWLWPPPSISAEHCALWLSLNLHYRALVRRGGPVSSPHSAAWHCPARDVPQRHSADALPTPPIIPHHHHRHHHFHLGQPLS